MNQNRRTLTVIRETIMEGKKVRLVEDIEIEDIQLCRIENNRLVYITYHNEVYYDIVTLLDRELHFGQFGFVKFDNSALVNCNHIDFFDEKYYVLHFKNGESTVVARWRVKQNEALKQLLQKYIRK